MRNYLALLGWSPRGDREMLTLDELISEFRLEDVKSAGAIFDERKLQSINAEYLRALPTPELVQRAQDWVQARWEPLAPLVQERARTLGEVYALTDFLYLPSVMIEPDEWERSLRRHPAFAEVLEAAAKRYAALDEWSAADIHAATVAAGEDAGVTQIRKAQEPIRLAVTGRSVGPPLWESLEVLGRDRTLARLVDALRRAASNTQSR